MRFGIYDRIPSENPLTMERPIIRPRRIIGSWSNVEAREFCDAINAVARLSLTGIL